MENASEEILINASHVPHEDFGNSYEFVLNTKLHVVECVKIDSLVHGIISQVDNASTSLDGMLFELNHVRINPRVDNTNIINCLTNALNEIGVRVSNQPADDSMASCFKPLGEISDNVRFYLSNQGRVIFLSPAIRPKLVAVQQHKNF